MAQAETQNRILAAAAELFGERGYVGTTTSSIAERAGVNEVTLFRRFGNKAGILRALAGVAAAARPDFPPPTALVEGDLKATLRNLAQIEIRDAIASGGLVLRLTLEARSVPEVREAMGTISSSNLERMAGFLGEHQANGLLRPDIDAHLLSEVFFSMTSTLVMQRMTFVEPVLPAHDEIESMAGQLIDLLWLGAGPGGGD
jgi:AcrR family transcriptional regulator